MTQTCLKTVFASAAIAILPLTAMAESPAPYDWSGPSVTFFAGSAKSDTLATDITGEEYDGGTPGATLSLNIRSGYAGVAAQYNLQSGAWVYGGGLELGRMGNKDTYVDSSSSGVTAEISTFIALTGRVGYAHKSTLFFAKAGPAWAKIRNAGGEFDGLGSEDSRGKWGYDGNEAGFGEAIRSGYTLGLGVEHALSNRLSLVAEYNYADFGTQTLGGASGEMDEPFSFRNEVQLVKIGLNYRF